MTLDSLLSGNGTLVGYLLAFGAAAVACLFGAARAMEIENKGVARGLGSLLLLSGVWAAFQIGALLAPLPWAEPLYIAGLTVGFATVFPWLWFCSAYTGRALHHHPAVVGGALLTFIVVTLTKVTNPLHGLYFTAEVVQMAEVVQQASGSRVVFEHGLVYWVSFGLAYVLAGAGYFMLLELFVEVRQGGGALAALAGLTALPAVLNLVGYATPWLMDVAHEPLGVAAFALGTLFLYQGTFKSVRLVGTQEAPTLIVSEDGRLRDWGGPAARLFPALRQRGAAGKPLAEILPELQEAVSRRDAAPQEASQDAEEEKIIEITVGETSGAPGPRYYRADDRPFGAGSAHFGRVVTLTDVTEEERRRRALEKETAALRTFTRITADRDASFKEKARRLLELGREQLSMPHGFLTRRGAEEGKRVVCAVGDLPQPQPGETAPLPEAGCHPEAEGLLAIADVEKSTREEALAYRELGLGSYIGAGVSVDGQPWGTFCFASPKARTEPFTEREEVFLELLSRWAGHEIERLRVQRRLQRQNERLDRFAGVLSHDLRNPLNVAQGRLQLAREAGSAEGGPEDPPAELGDPSTEPGDPSTEPGDPSAEREDPEGHLGAVGRALGRMNQIIEEMLTLTWSGQKLEAEDLSRCDLETLAREAWEQVETGPATLRVEGSVRFPADEPRLRRLLENLFRNAVEHAGPDVTVTVGPLEEDAPERGTSKKNSSKRDTSEGGTSEVEASESGFFVEDDGPGIPEEKREDIFKAGVSTREEGTGLGLSIVQSIARMHGWTARATEGREGGARFEFAGVGGEERPD